MHLSRLGFAGLIFAVLFGLIFLNNFWKTWLLYLCCCAVLTRVLFFVTPWTVACQAPRSWNFPSKYTGVGCHFLLQGIFLTQGLNWSLLWLLHLAVRFFYPGATWEALISLLLLFSSLSSLLNHVSCFGYILYISCASLYSFLSVG